MKKTQAIKIASTFFVIGTLLFLLQLIIGDKSAIIVLGLVFVIIAIIFNSIALLWALVQLIRFDDLESFFSICILLINIPIALTYFFFIIRI